MARTGSGSGSLLLTRRNARLDSFLKRTAARGLYERIRAYEPCVVVSDAVGRAYMHAVLSDERVYLTEFPPRALTEAVSFGRVRDIELVNDLPGFLSAKDRERCQHIRITYVAEKPARQDRDWLRRRDGREGFPPVAPPTRRASQCPTITHSSEGRPAGSRWINEGIKPVLKPSRSASCPNPETLGLLTVPHPPPSSSRSASPSSASPPAEGRPEGAQVTRRFGSVLTRLLRRDEAHREEEEREAELHLYAVSQTSKLYLQLQSSWNSFLMRSTLLLDPLYRRRSTASSDSISSEETAQLFRQLSSELLRDGIGVEELYLLLQELRTAALRSVTLRRLFWRSGEVCVFLVQTLEDCLQGRQSLGGVYTTDQLLLSSLIVQTLTVTFTEAEVEEATTRLLFADKGALLSRMLLALICDPQTDRRRPPTHSQLQASLSEYLDAACSLLFELLLLGHQSSRRSSAENFASVGWILRVLQPHPHLLPFVGYQARQVVQVLSGLSGSFLSPVQAVLLFQRCRLLLTCLQHDEQLAQHLQTHFREEFRYFVTPSSTEKLLPDYPIRGPTVKLIECLLSLIGDK
ncbi:uncharacterized protein C12orf56 homolog [Kryptolebias marmoratus]|uniref:uncharacterized protein C12orf56 homolog n=1 Tax=Kryptolebias marmoratus TaxID=37003 RepID=UPI0007F8F1D9|nr:uncharacterized protein C12orf56 homolog [Kryptolebias marmoratus]